MALLIPDLEGIAVRGDLGLDYLAVERAGLKGCGRPVDIHGHVLFQGDKVAGHIAVAQADVLEVFAQALRDIAGAVDGVGQGQAEVLVLQRGAADLLLVLGLTGGAGAVGHVGVGLAVLIEPHHEDVSDVGGYMYVLVKVAVALGHLKLGGVKYDGGADAVHEVVVLTGDVAAVVVDEVNSLDLDVFGVPVALIGDVVDGVLVGYVGAEVRSAVGDVVLIGAVQVGAGGNGLVVLGNAEHAALAEVVAAAHGDEAGVRYHAHEVRALLGERVLQGIVVNGLDADGGEVGGLAVQVGVQTLQHAAEIIDGARAGVYNVLKARDPVVGGQLGDLAALAVHPGDAFADVEGVGKSVLRDVVVGGEVGNQLALAVVLVEVVYEGRVVVEVAVGEEVPGGADAVKCGGGSIRKGVALLLEVGPGALSIGAGAGELIPHVGDVLVILGSYYLVGYDHLIKIDAVAQPGGVSAGAEGHAAHGIAAARSVHGRGDAALEEFGLGYGHQCPALAERLGLKRRHVGVVEVPHRSHVYGLVVREDPALSGRARRRRGSDLTVIAAAGGKREHHNQAQCKSQYFL